MAVGDQAISIRWQEVLCHIPSLFGRLVYLSSLRDQDTGRYHHEDGPNHPAAEDALRSCHTKVFADWLRLGMEWQVTDLERYLDRLETDLSEVLGAWESQAPYQHLLPESASEEERKMYMTDFATLLALLKQRSNAA